MSLVIGRLTLDDPESWPEQAGEALGTVGGLPVAGQRAGIGVTPGLTSFTTDGDTVALRQRARRQFRAALQNRPYALSPVYVAWDQDTEQSGWYALGASTIDVADISGLVSAFWKLQPELKLLGRRRTHRRAVSAYVRDRRLSTTPRDYRRTLFSTDFSTLSALSLVGLPSGTSDHVLHGSTTPVTLSAAQAGYGSASSRIAAGLSDLAVVSFEQAEASRSLGDVVIYDRQGTTTMLTTGPQTAWEEVYGPDQPLTSSDAPVLENGLCRVSYDAGNTDGLRIDFWTGSAWAEQGKVVFYRAGSAVDTFVTAQVLEWTPERGVVRVVMNLASDSYSREDIIVTLQRGWRGPRVELYPSRSSVGALVDCGMHFQTYAAANPNQGVIAVDASDVARGQFTADSGGYLFPGSSIGSSTFAGENFVSFIREGEAYDVALAVLQAGLTKGCGISSTGYGSGRSYVYVHGATGYQSVHLAFSAHHTHQDLDNGDFTAAAGTTLSGADGTAYGGTAATTTRTSAANHVTIANWLGSGAVGTYRLFARVRTTASTLNINAQTTTGFSSINGTTKNDASPVTTTSTTYTWLDLGTITADNTTLTIRMWATAAATTYLDRVEAFPLQMRASGNADYDGARDTGQAVLYDARPVPTLVSR